MPCVHRQIVQEMGQLQSEDELKVEAGRINRLPAAITIPSHSAQLPAQASHVAWSPQSQLVTSGPPIAPGNRTSELLPVELGADLQPFKLDDE
jgi:hypothetical protein